MKVIKIQQYLTRFEELLDILSEEIDIEEFSIGLIGINESEVRIVDNISNKTIILPTDLEAWDGEELQNIISNASAISIKVSDSYLQDLELEDYSMVDILPRGISDFIYANIDAGDVKEVNSSGTEMDVLDPSYWSTITGIKIEPKRTVSNTNNSFTKTTIGAQSQETASQKPQQMQSTNSLKVRDALKDAFDGCSMPSAEELDRLKYIFKEIFKHNLNLGDPSQDFKYDLIGVKKNKYTHVYVLKVPKIPFSKLVKEQERISGMFSPDAVYKIEESYKRVSGVFAIHVNVDTKVMNETHSLLDVYLKRNRFEDYEGRFGDTKNLVIGFSPSGLVLADATNQTACQYLVAGSTGSGKSVTIQSLILQFLADSSLIFYFDPKISDSLPYKNYGIAVANSSEEIYVQMEKLYKIYRAQKAKIGSYIDIEGYNAAHPDAKLRRILVIFDEYESFIISIKGTKDKLKQTEVKLTEIVAQGRSAGINVIIGSQTPSADYINKSLRGNLVLKLLGTACGPYFKNYQMNDLKPVPSSPQDDIYRYAGMFTSNLSKCIIKSLYIEIKKPSPELGKTEFQYLMDMYEEQGLIVATQEILDGIQIDGDDTDEDDSADDGTVLDDDFFDSLAKPIIEDEYEDEEDDDSDSDDDDLVEVTSNISKNKTHKAADTATNEVEDISDKKVKPQLSDEARYKKDNNLTPRERQMMIEYFAILDKKTKKISVPTSDIPVIFTGKTAKVPDTSAPKYNLYSSFSLSNKIRAKAINFVGNFSSGIADKLRHSVGLENSVAKKATYIFLYSFSKSRRLDNIQSLAFSGKTNTIYINEIPRVLDEDINVNDSGPYGDKYVVIDPKNFYYPEIASLYCLERLMFDNPAIAYKAIEQINAVVFNNEYYECVDLLFDAQDSLKEITIYDKVYYRSSKKAKSIRNKTTTDSHKIDEIESKPISSNTIASKSYQDDIDDFYNAMHLKEIQEKELKLNKDSSDYIETPVQAEPASQEIEELILGDSINTDNQDNYELNPSIEIESSNIIIESVPIYNHKIEHIDSPDSNGTLNTNLSEYQDKSLIPVTQSVMVSNKDDNNVEQKEITKDDNINLDNLTAREIRIIKAKKTKINLPYYAKSSHVDLDFTNATGNPVSNTMSVSLLNMLNVDKLLVKSIDNELELSRGYSEDSLKVLEKCSCSMFSKASLSSEFGKTFISYSDIILKNVLKTEMSSFVNIEDFFCFDTNYASTYKILYHVNNTSVLLLGRRSELDLAPIDLKYFCTEVLRVTPIETLKQCMLDMANADRYSKYIYSTDSTIYRILLMYRLICNPTVNHFLITNTTEFEQFNNVRAHFPDENIYFILNEDNKSVLNIKNTTLNKSIESSLLKILSEFSTAILPMTLIQAISELYLELDMEAASNEILNVTPLENIMNLEEIYPTPVTYLNNPGIAVSDNRLSQIEENFNENISSLDELAECNALISRSIFEMYTGITYDQFRTMPASKMKDILYSIKLSDIDSSSILMLEQALEAELTDIVYADKAGFDYADKKKLHTTQDNFNPSMSPYMDVALGNSENCEDLEVDMSNLAFDALSPSIIITKDSFYTYINGNCISKKLVKIQMDLYNTIIKNIDIDPVLSNIKSRLYLYEGLETKIETDIIRNTYIVYLDGESREFTVEHRANSLPRDVFNKNLESDNTFKVPHFYLYDTPIKITEYGAVLSSNYAGSIKTRLDTKIGFKIYDALGNVPPIIEPIHLTRVEFKVPLDYKADYDNTLYQLTTTIIGYFKGMREYYEIDKKDIINITAITLSDIRELLFKNRR